MAGFLELFNNPANQGILNLAAGLLQASGPSPMPVSFGQAAGQGLQQGTQAFQQAQQAQQQQQLFGLKKAEAERAAAMEASRQAALARLSGDPRFAGMGDLLQVAPAAVINSLLQQKAPGNTVVPAGAAVLGPDGKPLFTNPVSPKPMGPSSLGQLIAERDALPAGDPRRAEYDAAIKKATTSQPLVQISTGTKEADKAFAGEYVSFATGGYADTQKQLEQLQGVINALEKEPNITGPVVGNIPRSARTITNPRSVAVQEELEEVAQRNLRLILGAQFTEKEGERLISRAYNPALPQEENAKRVKRLFTQIKEAADAKLEASRHFLTHGSLEGWKGKLWSMKDFDPERGEEPKASPPKSSGMTAMPPAAQHKGRVLEASDGKRYKSDGMKWQPLK